MANIRFKRVIPFTQNRRQCWAAKLPVGHILNLTLPYHHASSSTPSKSLTEKSNNPAPTKSPNTSPPN